LSSLGGWNMSFRRWIVPAILIWIGMTFLTRGPRSLWHSREHGPRGSLATDPAADPATDSSEFIHASAFLGGFNRKCSSQTFRGGDITAFMGGGKIDLRDARIDGNEAVLDIFAMMGGVEIEVPRDWIVEPRFTPILGGYEDRTKPQNQGSQRLIIHGTAIMGGVTVKN
jgi:predicted membrane protein